MIKDIDLYSMLNLFFLLVLPLLLTFFYKINIFKEVAISVLRMTVQLLLMAYLLNFLFNSKNVIATSLWLLVMVCFANMNLLKRAKVEIKNIWPYTLVPLALGSILILIMFVTMVVRPAETFSPRYLIPIYGMIVGNSMTANIIGIERFINLIKRNRDEYLSILAYGATPFEASISYFKEAYRASLLPMISTMATLGLVAIPGMMTGQILGGNSPFIAIKYQMGIMIAIFSSVSLTTFGMLLLFRKKMFDDNGVPL